MVTHSSRLATRHSGFKYSGSKGTAGLESMHRYGLIEGTTAEHRIPGNLRLGACLGVVNPAPPTGNG